MVQPRLFMTTHMAFDPYQNEETVAQVREHWKGPYHFGAPDGIVVNVTKDQIWVREGVLPDFPNSRSPQFDFSNGQLIVPHPGSAHTPKMVHQGTGWTGTGCVLSGQVMDARANSMPSMRRAAMFM